MFPGNEVLWTEKRGVRRQTFPHKHLQGKGYKETPFAFAIETGRLHRYRMVAEQEDQEPPVIPVYRKAGYTDLVVLPMFNVDGVVNKCIGYGTKVGESDNKDSRCKKEQ